MNESEYIAEVKKIRNECRKMLQKLWNDYAIEHNPVKIGDVINVGADNIKVDKIWVAQIRERAHPFCVYSGPLLTKKGEPYKRGERRDVFQGAIKTINGEAIDHETPA